MVEPKGTRPITVAQVVGVLALAVIIFFIIAFASKAVTTYRLRAWRDDLQAEIAAMELEKQNLLLEIKRRESMAWVDEALKEAGQVPPGVLAVRLVSPDSVPADRQPSELAGARESLTGRMEGLRFFDNPNWRAWVQLLLHRE